MNKGRFELFPEDFARPPQRWTGSAKALWTSVHPLVQEEALQAELTIQELLQQRAAMIRRMKQLGGDGA